MPINFHGFEFTFTDQIFLKEENTILEQNKIKPNLPDTCNSLYSCQWKSSSDQMTSCMHDFLEIKGNLRRQLMMRTCGPKNKGFTLHNKSRNYDSSNNYVEIKLQMVLEYNPIHCRVVSLSLHPKINDSSTFCHKYFGQNWWKIKWDWCFIPASY